MTLRLLALRAVSARPTGRPWPCPPCLLVGVALLSAHCASSAPPSATSPSSRKASASASASTGVPPPSRLSGRGPTKPPGQKALDAALAAARAGDLTTAVAQSRAALEHDPKLERAYLLLGSACALQENDACEAQAYRAGLEALPESSALHQEMGFFLLRQGRTEQAIRRLEQARAMSSPPSPDLLADLAFAYKMRGDLNLARTTAEAAIASDEGCLKCRMAMGEIALADKDFKAAEAAFAAAVNIDEKNLEARRSRAKSAFLAGDVQRAADLYLDLAARSPDDVRVRVQTGQVLLQAKRPAEAVEELQAADRLLPNQPGLLKLLARAQAEAGDAQAARSSRRKARALEKKSAQ